MGTTEYTPDLGEKERFASFRRLVASRLGLPSDATKPEILDEVFRLKNPLIDPGKQARTFEAKDLYPMCEHSACHGCGCKWEDMAIVGEQSDAEVRVCECPSLIVAETCLACLAADDEDARGDDAYQAKREMEMEGASA